jgi:zinc transport system substrate-binding protein
MYVTIISMFNTTTSPLRRRIPRAGVIAALTIVGASALTACSDASSDTSSAQQEAALTVAAGFYPLQFAAERVGGDRVSVESLTPPGAEAHDVELTPRQVAALQDADLVVYLRGFQPAVDEAVADLPADKVLEVSEGLATLEGESHSEDEAHSDGEKNSEEDGDDHSHEGTDPHVWLDPTLMGSIAERIQDRFADADEVGAETYTENLRDLDAELTALDEEWTSGVAECESRDLVVSHEAFAYLGARYDFEQVGLSGLTPESEPSPARLAEVADFVRDNDVTTIYFESLVDPAVAETIAGETGAATAPLDPIEGLQDGSDDDYLSIMRSNLDEVVKGQRCS